MTKEIKSKTIPSIIQELGWEVKDKLILSKIALHSGGMQYVEFCNGISISESNEGFIATYKTSEIIRSSHLIFEIIKACKHYAKENRCN